MSGDRSPAGPARDQAPPPRPVSGAGDRRRRQLAEAAEAFEAGHYRDVLRVVSRLGPRESENAQVRELHGLTLYRLEKWEGAIRELEAFERLTGSVDQHAVLADCHRALRRWDRVEQLWDELRRASPGAELVTEGRIVAAGALADRGDVVGAVRLLERAPAPPHRPKGHHLRLWYALADLRERTGDVPGARGLFARIVKEDAQFADAAERLGTLGR